MIQHDESVCSDEPGDNRQAFIAEKIRYCIEHYQPYLRKDFNQHQLSVITNIPVSNLENYFDQSTQPFNQYLDEWRVKYAKQLMSSGKVRDMEIKTIGALSGFSSAKRFTKTFRHIEGALPEIDQQHIY